MADEYRRAPHAHNLYLNTLTERGTVGLLIVLLLLGTWAVRLWRCRPVAGAAPDATAIGCAALSGWFVTVLIGFANTTLHHEHAMLAVLSLGLWLGERRAPLLATPPAEPSAQPPFEPPSQASSQPTAPPS